MIVLVAGCGRADPLLEEVPGLEGEVTWRVTWDDDGHALGHDDCTYRRTYAAAEDRSQPWLCPDCDTVYRAEVALTGRRCYAGISDTTPSAVEWLGHGDDTWYRAGLENFVLVGQGEAALTRDRLSVSATTGWVDRDGGGQYRLDIDGALERVTVEADPWHGYRVPDKPTCGWKTGEAEPYDGRYRLVEGRTLPDGLFRDTCGEGVRLRDLAADRYTVIVVSAADCPPCQQMAAEERAFIDDMADRGIDVQVITLLAPSLSGVIDPTPRRLLTGWSTSFDLDTPVLGDRGWGYWVVGEALGDRFAYPSVVVVSPRLKVLDIQAGFAGYDLIARVIDRS